MATVYGPDDDDRRRAQARRVGVYKYMRDISVNLWANLIAAAIIYLLAQATGAIRENSALTIVAAVLLVFAGFVAYIALLLTLLESPRYGKIVQIVVGLGVAGCVYYYFTRADRVDHGFDVVDGFILSVSAAAFLTASCLAELLRSRRRHEPFSWARVAAYTASSSLGCLITLWVFGGF